MKDKEKYYSDMYKNAPTRDEFCILHFMCKTPDNEFNIFDINNEFLGILWVNSLTPYRILKSMVSKKYIEKCGYSLDYGTRYMLTELGKYIGVTEWQ